MSEFPHILSKNKLADASSVISSVTQDSFYRLAHLYDRSRFSEWRGASGTSEQIVTFNFSSAVEMDTFILDKGFVLTGGTVYFQHSANGTSWTTAVTISALTNTEIYWRTFTAVTKQYWRIKITGLTVQPRISNLWAGKRIELTFGAQGDFDPYERDVMGSESEGAAGAFQFTKNFTRRVLRVNFENLTDTEYSLIAQWRDEAAAEGKNWWWLTFPTSEPDDPLYLNGRGISLRFPIRSTVRSGSIEAWEVL